MKDEDKRRYIVDASEHARQVTALKREFARRLINAMNALGWTQSQLAVSANKHFEGKGEITRDNISRYCTGINLPGATRLSALAKALGVASRDLVPRRTHTMPFGPESPRAAPQAPLSLKDLGNGMAHITVDQVVPWETAVQITNLLPKGGGPDDADNSRRSQTLQGDNTHGRAVDRRGQAKSLGKNTRRPRSLSVN